MERYLDEIGERFPGQVRAIVPLFARRPAT